MNELISNNYQTEVYDVIDPVARVSGEPVIDQHQEAVFDGRESSDNVGIAKFRWTFVYEDVEHELNGTETLFRFDKAGIYLVTLNVSDSYHNWHLNHFNVTVRDITPPVAEAQENIYIGVHDRVCFNSSGSSDNLGIVDWSWSFYYEGVIVELHGNRACFTFDIPGDYKVNLQVRDAAGLPSTDNFMVYVGEVITAEIGADNITNTTIRDQSGNVVAHVRVSGNGTLYMKKMEWKEARARVGPVIGNKLDLGIFLEIDLAEFDWIYIEIPYNDSDLPSRLDVKSIKLYFWNETTSRWEVVENSGIDMDRKVIWGNVSHLTMFAPLAFEKETPEVKEELSWQTLLIIAIIVVLVVLNLIFIVVVFRRRDRKHKGIESASGISPEGLEPDEKPEKKGDMKGGKKELKRERKREKKGEVKGEKKAQKKAKKKDKRKEETFVEPPEEMSVCPECWEDITQDDEVCIHCGYSPFTDGAQGSDEVTTVEEKDKEKEDTFEELPEENNVCPECWEDITSEDKICIQCGYSPLTDGVDVLEEGTTVDKKNEKEEETFMELPDKNVCPECREGFTSEDKICIQCGYSPLTDREKGSKEVATVEEEKEFIETGGKTAKEIDAVLDEIEDTVKQFDIYEVEYLCPICAEIIEEESPYCSNCGIRFEDEETSLAKSTDDEVSKGLKGRYIDTDEDYDFEIVEYVNLTV